MLQHYKTCPYSILEYVVEYIVVKDIARPRW